MYASPVESPPALPKTPWIVRLLRLAILAFAGLSAAGA